MVRIARYKATRKALFTDARILGYIWFLCQVAGKQPITATQERLAQLLDEHGICAKRTFEDSSRRLSKAAWLWRVMGRGRASYGYYVPDCALRRMRDAVKEPDADYDLYESVVCYTPPPSCRCMEEMYINNARTHRKRVRVYTLLLGKHRKRKAIYHAKVYRVLESKKRLEAQEKLFHILDEIFNSNI
jgi:hypothetical protein